MDNIHGLPNEILYSIFQKLSQRDLINGLGTNRLWYLSIMQFRNHQATIEFCSSNQLKRFLDTANESITFDLCKVILHFPIDNHTRSLSTLIKLSPRLHQIVTENDGEPYPHSIIKAPTPVSFNHVTFFYRNTLITKITEENASRRQLKSLEYSLGFHLPPNSTIRLQSIGSIKTKLARDSIQDRNNNINYHYYDNHNSNNNSNQELVHYYSKTLVMPTFNHLISLSVALNQYQLYPKCYEYEMDEKLFQSIHQSCPKLEKLYLFDFYMNISDEYDGLHLSQNATSGIYGLKSFGMRGAFFDPRCCTFLNLIYPYLESFDYTYSYEMANDYDSRYLQSTFCDMITRFASLKKLSLCSLCYDTELCKFWPDYSFIQFLNNHPNQIFSLNYPGCLYPISPSSNTTDDHLVYKNNNYDIIISNGLFFNHLSSLTMRSKQLIRTVSNFLIYNNDTLTISKSVKELTIYDDKRTNNNDLYLFDWLVLFPALDALKVQQQVLVDLIDSDEADDSDGLINQHINNDSSKVLHHRLSDKIKRQSVSDYKKKTGLYKLKSLELNHIELRFVNGLTSFFENFNKLNQLVLKHIHYSHIGWQGAGDLPGTITSIDLDIPHLCLDYILVTDICTHSWDNIAYYPERLVKKVKVMEYSTGNSDRYYRALSRCYPNSTFTFKLYAKYVDLFFYVSPIFVA
ncbi:unnamed protein product [Cunninghamella blakesleeana]